VKASLFHSAERNDRQNEPDEDYDSFMAFDLTPLGQAGEWLGGAALAKAFLSRILGLAADEVAGIIADPIAEYRKELSERRKTRVVRVTSRAAQMIESAGVQAERVPDYIALPLLECASLTDDETLQDKWAGLLASAADRASPERVHPSFSEILKTLSPQEVKFLDACHDEVVERGRGDRVLGDRDSLLSLYANLGLTRLRYPYMTVGVLREHPVDAPADWRDFSVALDHLHALKFLDVVTAIDLEAYTKQLLSSIMKRPRQAPAIPRNPPSGKTYVMTEIGIEFVRACRGPQPIQASG
jgi:hypothetical protein